MFKTVSLTQGPSLSIFGGSWQTHVLVITTCERYHNYYQTDRLTLAPGSRARMDLAAANEAVPPPISR